MDRIEEMIAKFKADWWVKYRKKPTPFELLANIPPTAGDSDTMALMAKFMESD